MCQMDRELVRFVSDKHYKEESNVFPLSAFDPEEYEVMIAIGSSFIREKLSNELPIHTKYFSFVHPSALILSKDVVVGEGSFIGANSILTCNIKVGKHGVLNRGNHIGHDCRIGSFFSMMPNAVVSGNCVIDSLVWMGTNSSIRENLIVCDNVTIGLNSGVIKDIYEPGTYVGVPARKI